MEKKYEELDGRLRLFCDRFSTGGKIPGDLASDFFGAVSKAVWVKSSSRPHLVDEITGLVTVKMLRAMREGRYFPTRVPVFAYILVVVHNAMISNGYKDVRIGERELPLVDGILPNGSVGLHRPVEEEAGSNIFWDQVLEVINQLPSPNGQILAMDVLGYSNEEIGKRCGLSVLAVKMRLHRARKEMRDKFEDGG